MEDWKQINDYSNYTISNLGNVRNDKFGRIITGKCDTKGYNWVLLYKNSKPKKKYIHRLICEYFLDGFDPDLEIDHIDRNRQNNNLNNLRCVSRSENNRNRTKREGCSSKYKGVCFDKRRCKWKSAVRNNEKLIHLGYFETEEEASQKYLDWNNENGYLV